MFGAKNGTTIDEEDRKALIWTVILSCQCRGLSSYHANASGLSSYHANASGLSSYLANASGLSSYHANASGLSSYHANASGLSSYLANASGLSSYHANAADCATVSDQLLESETDYIHATMSATSISTSTIDEGTDLETVG